MAGIVALAAVVALLLAALIVLDNYIPLLSAFLRWAGRTHGGVMQRRTAERRKLFFQRAEQERGNPHNELASGAAAAPVRPTGDDRAGEGVPLQRVGKRDHPSPASSSLPSRGRVADSGTSLDEDWERVEEADSTSANKSSEASEHNKRARDERGLIGDDDVMEADRNYKGVIGFFHPFCNAGGGGERVLWTAIRATQNKWPNALCVVYTGDHDVDKEQILAKVKQRFSIDIHPPTIVFLYLSTRHYVLASTWPRFTLLGQSLGSLLVGYDAFNLLVPDIFIDTMGYAFTLALSKFLFPHVPTVAYVHYPTISTDMLGSLDVEQSSDNGKGGVHAGSGRGLRGLLKRKYWHLFARLYGWVGSSVDVVMTNSSWTGDHIRQLWGSSRARARHLQPSRSAGTTSEGASVQSNAIEVVFPPVAVEQLSREIPLTQESENLRTPTLLYIAQFRPEKNHELVLRAFAELVSASSPSHSRQPSSDTSSEKQPDQTGGKYKPGFEPKLNLIGSVRDDQDKSHVYSLRLLAHSLHITSQVNFILEASWPECVAHLRTASVGVNAMWNEHFGIGVVEYQAAGLLTVVNDSGGPKRDIVLGGATTGAQSGVGPDRTGWWASTVTEYAAAFSEALELVVNGGMEVVQWRRRARTSAERFSEAAFERRWVAHVSRVVPSSAPASSPAVQ